MGLDFGVYYKKKNEEIPNWETDYNAYQEWMNTHELCYGRKSWELVHTLNLPIEEDEDPIVKKEDWDNLISSINKFLNGRDSSYLVDIFKNYDIAEKYGEKDWEVPQDVFDSIVQYEVWYDDTFGETPILGYEFALGYIIEFYNANGQVQKYLEDDEYEVRAYVSW